MNSRVLLIDDEAEVRENLREFLELHGYEVSVAENGQRALEELSKGDPPCFVLLDLIMPVMDGWGFLSALERQGRSADLQIVVSTSAPEKAPAALPLLSKPVDLDELLRVVEEACRVPTA